MTTLADNQTPIAPGTDGADFEMTLLFEASAERVFEAILEPEHVTQWWAPATGTGEKGGKLSLGWAVMRIATAVRPALVRWTTIDCEAEPDWVGTTIEFAIAPVPNGGTSLHFRHAGLRALACFNLCRQGWTHFLRSLVSYVDTGEGAPLGSPAAENRHREGA